MVVCSISTSPPWRWHLSKARLPIAGAIVVNLAIILLFPIPSEASALDAAFKGDGADLIKILSAAAPVVLAIGWPVACVIRLSLPLQLLPSPPASHIAAGLLLACSAIGTAASVSELRSCIAADVICRYGAFSLSRNPVSSEYRF